MRRPLLALPLLLSACGEAPSTAPLEQRSLAPLPPQVCIQAREGMARLRDNAALVIDKPGEATIDTATWLAMGESGRNQLAQLIAFEKACSSADAEPEQQVTIRSETGQTLMQRTVETGVDISTILDGAAEPQP